MMHSVLRLVQLTWQVWTAVHIVAPADGSTGSQPGNEGPASAASGVPPSCPPPQTSADLIGTGISTMPPGRSTAEPVPSPTTQSCAFFSFTSNDTVPC